MAPGSSGEPLGAILGLWVPFGGQIGQKYGKRYGFSGLTIRENPGYGNPTKSGNLVFFLCFFFSASSNQDQKPFGRVEGVAGSHLVLGGAWKVVGEGSERWVTVWGRFFGFLGKKSVEFSDFPKEKSGPRRTKKLLTDLFYP